MTGYIVLTFGSSIIVYFVLKYAILAIEDLTELIRKRKTDRLVEQFLNRRYL